jgi:hypothetical protein
LGRFRIPEIVLGSLLTVAIFAIGASVQIINPENHYQGTQAPNSAPKGTTSGGGGSPDERVAEYTEGLAWATVFIALSTLGVLIVTWRAGVRQSGDMQAALRHAEKSLAAVERAYVFIDGFTPEITTAEDLDTPGHDLPQRYWHRKHLYMHRFAVLPRWKNGGNTPTRNMRIQVNWRGPSGPIPPVYRYQEPAQPFFLGPHTVEHSPPVEMPEAARIVDYGVHREGDEPQCWIWGRADYQDIFNKPHFLEWCYTLRFDAHDGKKLRVTLIQWGDYNRTDTG